MIFGDFYSMLSCMFLAMAVTLFIWVPVYVPLVKCGVLNPKSVRVIEAAKADGRYAVARLFNTESIGAMIQGRGSHLISNKATYWYEVDGRRYEYVLSNVRGSTENTLTVYWEVDNPGKAYSCCEVVQGTRVVVMTAVLPVTWLLAVIAISVLL